MTKTNTTVAFLLMAFVVMAVMSYHSTTSPKKAPSAVPTPSTPSFLHRRVETPEQFLTRRQAPPCDDYDCFGICGGTARKDCADVCNGTAVEDCAGVCNGGAVKDCNGECNGPAKEDCTGKCGGKAFVDCNGRCGGPSVRSCDGICMAPCSDIQFGMEEFRTADGSANNRQRTQMGQARRPTFHFAGFHYQDGISVPRGGNPSTLPSPRVISNAVFNRASSGPSAADGKHRTLVLGVWGQFIDHDITATPVASPCDDSFRIPVPAGDPRFDPQSRGGVTMQFCRSLSGQSPREQRSDVTPFIDGSAVYGSDAQTATRLRTGTGGRLVASTDQRFLPMNTVVNVTMANTEENVSGDNVFAAGDGRANENVMLAALQTLWMREHNRFVDSHILCTGGTADLEDELRYQLGRKWVYSLIEHITWNEFLPALFGKEMPAYGGYNPQVDASMSIDFSSSAYRFGHSLMATNVPLKTNDGTDIRNGSSAAAPLRLSDNFFNPPRVLEFDIAAFLKGITDVEAEAVDSVVVTELRDRLFRSLDLVAINIQRGRDHGIASYNDMRVAYGLPRCADYNCISANPVVAAGFQAAYGAGRIDDVDAYPGGLAEDHVPGAVLGPLFSAMITEQFTRLRDGDRFWYENDLWTDDELEIIRNTKLSDVIKRNTDITNLQDDVFFMPDA